MGMLMHALTDEDERAICAVLQGQADADTLTDRQVQQLMRLVEAEAARRGIDLSEDASHSSAVEHADGSTPGGGSKNVEGERHDRTGAASFQPVLRKGV
jgi:hypothetical protein